MLPFLEKAGIQHFLLLSNVFWLYMALQYRSSTLSNFFVVHTSGSISSRPADFLSLIFVSTTRSSS